MNNLTDSTEYVEEVELVEVCEEELYDEYVDASGQLVQFEDE